MHFTLHLYIFHSTSPFRPCTPCELGRGNRLGRMWLRSLLHFLDSFLPHSPAWQEECGEDKTEPVQLEHAVSLQEIGLADTMIDGVWQDLESSPAVRDCFWFVWGLRGNDHEMNLDAADAHTKAPKPASGLQSGGEPPHSILRGYDRDKGAIGRPEGRRYRCKS